MIYVPIILKEDINDMMSTGFYKVEDGMNFKEEELFIRLTVVDNIQFYEDSLNAKFKRKLDKTDMGNHGPWLKII